MYMCSLTLATPFPVHCSFFVFISRVSCCDCMPSNTFQRALKKETPFYALFVDFLKTSRDLDLRDEIIHCI